MLALYLLNHRLKPTQLLDTQGTPFWFSVIYCNTKMNKIQPDVESPRAKLRDGDVSVWPYLVGRTLTGLALGNTGIMYASLTEAAPRNCVALSLSLINGSAPLGALVGALLVGLVVSELGVHWLFAVDAAVLALVAIILTMGYREDFVPKPMPCLTVMLGDALRTVVQSPVASTLFLISFVYNTAFFFSYTYLPVRIGEIVGADAAPGAIGIIQGIAGATTLAGSAIWGALAEVVGHRRLLVLLMLAATVLWLPLFAAQGFISLAIAWAAFNAVSPAVTSLMFAIISLSLPDSRRGSVLSMIYLPMNLAFIVGPFSASLVATRQEVRDVFLVSAGLSLLAFLIFLMNLKRMRE